eukprot:TRINITY_DN57327_c0_g1_i1.p1 TRINITY_DN57327_c0_g1~~TRINITY_DN57327_c0_g1_i1.p1  ORF type:complete len:801 (-),score=142.39 TRINITY_DN57327_c0_g1_i1:264-2666(-)
MVRWASVAWLLVCSWDHGSASSTGCPATAQPLLWSLSEGDTKAFIIGTYNISSTNMQLSPQVATAMSCADIAYFPTGCSLEDTSPQGIGHYMAHCAYYPVVNEKDSIAERLSSSQVSALQASISQLIAFAPENCKSTASTLQADIQELPDNDTYRTTLLDLYHNCIETVNPNWCGSASSGNPSYDTYLRQEFGTTKPTFGLEDISVECQVFQGNDFLQDQSLAKSMIKNFQDPTWVNNVSTLLGSMEEVIRCGDLTNLKNLMVHLQGLPLASERNLQNRNSDLTFGVKQAMKTNPGKTLLFAIPITHLVDAAGKTGLITLLANDGITATRIGPSSPMPACQASTYQAPGAAALQHCLKPPAESQPASCDEFEQTFRRELGKDVMQGRQKDEPPKCDECLKGTQPCSCELKWTNIDGFKNLCESTQVGGSYGKVYYLDMTRNPGSTRTGQSLAEKTVISSFQNCYASSCETNMLQESATRNWYKNEEHLAVASVSLRELGTPYTATPATDKESGSGGGGLGGIAWWIWLLILAAVAAAIFGLIKVFRLPKRGSEDRQRSYNDYDFQDTDDRRYSASWKEADYSAEMQPLQPADYGDMRKMGEHAEMANLPTYQDGLDMRAPEMAGSGMAPGMAPPTQPSGMDMRLPEIPGSGMNLRAPELAGRGMPNMDMPGMQGSMSPSLQAYQGSMSGNSLQMPGLGQDFGSGPNNSLLEQAMKMSKQIEATGSQAMQSITSSPFNFQQQQQQSLGSTSSGFPPRQAAGNPAGYMLPQPQLQHPQASFQQPQGSYQPMQAQSSYYMHGR